MSEYGHWIEEGGLPAFVYDTDQHAAPEATWDPIVAPPTSRHWVALGNRRLQLVVDNEGGCAIWDEREGCRWLTAPDPGGTGHSVVVEPDGTTWGTADDTTSERTFGPTWFRVRTAHHGVTVERTLRCPEGEAGWVLVEVRLHLDAGAPAARTVRHVERWALRPRWCNLFDSPTVRRDAALAAVHYDVDIAPGRLRAVDVRDESALEPRRRPLVFGRPIDVVLEAVGDTIAEASHNGGAHPTLEVATVVDLAPGEARTLWFRFGEDDGSVLDDPAAAVEEWASALHARLPRAATTKAPAAAREVPWHAALLTGGACRDDVIGGHTLNQGSAYAFDMGFNGAARDPFQHALPLVYTEPDLALSVLRNTLAWATPEGELPYALDGAKGFWTGRWQPSDQPLWAMWLASEYGAATGDLDAFATDLPYHPGRGAEPVPLFEHLRRNLRFFVDVVGLGEHGHVRICNADWNDMALEESGADREAMIEKGESILNSAMAAWVLPVFAGLCDRLGETGVAEEARGLGERLRLAVAADWNGRWFRRAYGPGTGPVGDDDCWLEVQPWAILCGAADDERARSLLATVDEQLRAGSPLGARVRHPDFGRFGAAGEGTAGGIWASINMTLIWAAAHVDPDLGWDEWRRMTLANHAHEYPWIWEGTLSGPDCWNAPESSRAGRTWAFTEFGNGMQSFPVNNLHAHAQPLLAYLRLLGVEPTAAGALRVAGGSGRFESTTFTVEEDGTGRLTALGPVRIETKKGAVDGGPGEVTW